MTALGVDGKALEHAGSELWKDKEVVLTAVSNYKPNISYDHSDGDVTADFGSSAMFGHILEYLPESMRGDRDVALAAVKQYGRALEFVTAELQDDEEVATTAINNDWKALQFASKRLRALPRMIDTAVQLQSRLTSTTSLRRNSTGYI